MLLNAYQQEKLNFNHTGGGSAVASKQPPESPKPT